MSSPVNAIIFTATMEPRQKFLDLQQVKHISGEWTSLVSCSGCSEDTYQIISGVTSGNTYSKNTTTSKSLAATLGLEGSIGFADASVSVTGTIGKETARGLQNSFTHKQESTITMKCAKKNLYQWSSTITTRSDLHSTARLRNHFQCTNDSPKDPTDINWQPEDSKSWRQRLRDRL